MGTIKIYFTLLFTVLSVLAVAQSRPIKGRVFDAKSKETLPFCHISLEGSDKGTLSDINGNFELTLPNTGVLIFTYTGYGKLRYDFSEYSNFQIGLHPESTSLQDVVVSGTMQEVSRINSSIAVDVYTPSFFRKNPSPNIFDALSMVNGIQPQINCNVCNAGDIHINGMEGAYTMVLIDGMPIVSSLSTVYGLSGIPNSMIKRIEVVKGPASTLYGSEAVAGLINIITHDPESVSRLHVDAFGTTYGEYNLDIANSFKTGKSKALLGINHFNYWNPVDNNNDNFTDITLQRRTSLFNKWDFNRKNNLQAGLALRYIYEERWGGEMQWNRSMRGSDEVYAESIFTNRFEIIGNYELPVSSGKLMLDYSYNKHTQDSYYGELPFMAIQDVAFTQLRWQKTKGNHQILAGLPFRYIYYDDDTPGTADSEGNNQAVQTYLPGIFIQDEWSVTNKLNVLSGMRFDYHNSHGKIFSPRLALRYRTGENSTLRLSTGNGFRVVNLFTEDHAALSGSRQVIIMNELKPEQSWNVNSNYQTSIPLNHGYISFDVSAFYTYFSNKIVGDFISDANSIIYDNLNGHAISKGFSMNIEASFTSGLKIITGATFMDVFQMEENNSDQSLERVPQLFAPKLSGTFAVSYPFHHIGLSIDLTGRVTGPMYLPVVPNDFRPAQSPWFSLINLQLTKQIGGSWELYGGVKNLLNFVPENPLLRPFDPFDRFITENNPNDYRFDTAYNYAPLQGIRGFIGLRFTLQ